jgi:putative ABC transport system permease protein
MVAATIFGESLVLALLGGSVGMALTYPASAVFIGASGGLAKGFDVATPTLIAQAVATVLVGLVGGAWPAWTVARVNVARALARQAV